MTENVKKVLNDYTKDYAANRLRNTYYKRLTPESRKDLSEKFLYFLKPIIDGGALLSDIEKATIIYEVISRCVIYNHSEEVKGKDDMRDTYVAGLAAGKAICMGVAEIYTLLCNRVNLRVETVIGYGGDPARKGGPHAWNIIWLEDEYGNSKPYHLDLTWDLHTANNPNGSFNYFLKSDEYMRAHNHEWLSERYAVCPKNRADIPEIKPAAITYMCNRFKTARQSLTTINI